MPVDQDVVSRIVKSVSRSWVPHVYLIGGEPSLIGVDRLNQYAEELAETSSVTIVTNGEIYLDGLTDKLACLGVPLHGNPDTHDFIANSKGSYDRVLDSIEHYVDCGFDVRCIPILTKQNHNQMYEVIQTAYLLGMESVFVDRYEEGGIGSRCPIDLKPTREEFHTALYQMIAARDEFGIPVGWGTAIPYCLDPLLLEFNMTADCGAGITFAAINPRGDVRTCNQSDIVYGNVLEQPIEEIWRKPELSQFRSLDWVTEPCRSCTILRQCLCGCKVDANCSPTYCIDYALREPGVVPCEVYKEALPHEPDITVPRRLRHFGVNRYTRLNLAHEESYLVTRYQTVQLDETAVILLKDILQGVLTEEELIARYSRNIERAEIRRFISRLFLVGAIDKVGE
jgi:radical SAM protein with 4Fe4S-binding SPASM domain